MTIISNINETNLTSLIKEGINVSEFISSTIMPTITTKIIISTTTNSFLRQFNTTRIYPFLRSPIITTTTSQTSCLLHKYFMFKSPFHYIIRSIELFILSLTIPLYVIVFILFIELTILRVNTNTAVSGGNSRSRRQRRRQHMHNLIWTSNYLLVDLLNLLYEVIYVIIHLSGQLPLQSFAGRFYCQSQVYVPLYLTVLMAYSLTAISIYRRRHFINLNKHMKQSNIISICMISSLWMLPIITSVFPTFLLVYLNILKITQHETTNQCQISYTYESNMQAMYIFYRLGNVFLLPISISLACYITIYADLIRMQQRFNRAFKRHVHIRKNLISQILFLFLNFAVFWLPAEIITLYTKNRHLKDTVQVTKCLNILLDPLIITGFDTRFKSAAKQLLSTPAFHGFRRCFNSNRQHDDSTTIATATAQIIPRRRFKHSRQMTTNSEQMTTGVTWNIGNNDDITVLESVSNHSPQKKQRTRRQQKQRSISSTNQRPLENRPRTSTQIRMKIVENHI
ncbi:unnamed protein product [Adineta steineri]|uniref:G-protein coupled receptors family 1 profile domain-containing protein n=1 Tax=Adineta steineri TaxID=433720 RepID=A0A814TVX7_9BILA|nr:unnamed protein product [Adineta steineri]CAF3971355.1 unnamed protein product [Adineta steineri]